MTTTELSRPAPDVLVPLNEHVPASADEVYAHLDSLTQELERARPDLEAMGLVEAGLQELSDTGRHRALVLDASVEPGGAFKFDGAAFGLWCLQQANPYARTVTTGTAGNFGGTLAQAAHPLGITVKAYTPRDLNAEKRRGMMDNGAEVRPLYDDVAGAIAAAQRDANAQGDQVAFLHPYNNPNSIRGQQLVGEQMVRGLLERATRGELNLREDRVVILVQRGGGSLITGVAVEVKKWKDAGVLGDNVEVHEVRPKRFEDGELNRKYDGLAVDEPGSWSRPIIEDARFVQAHHEISEVDTARAAARLAKQNDVEYEFSGLAGMAAVEKLMRQTGQPTTFVTVLSGRNAAAGTYDYLWQVLEEHNRSMLPSAPATAVPRTIGNALLSGPTAGYQQGLVEPSRPAPEVSLATAVTGDAAAAYYQQLAALGIELATRQY